jgi:hypothetical protein
MSAFGSGDLSAGRHRLGEMGLGLQHSSTSDFSEITDSEAAARLVLLGYLDGTLGDSEPNTPLEFAKAQLIRDAIGDNRNASMFDQFFGRRKSESAETLLASGRLIATLEKVIRNNRKMLSSLPAEKK